MARWLTYIFIATCSCFLLASCKSRSLPENIAIDNIQISPTVESQRIIPEPKSINPFFIVSSHPLKGNAVTSEQKPIVVPVASEIKKEHTEPITILFTGDLMFDRYIRQVAQKKGNNFIFAQVKELLAENDLVVSNLEGPITENKSVSVNAKINEKNNLVFTFDPSLAKTLSELNIKLVNIGNNHILNFGPEGIKKTKEYLISANINYFGDTGDGEGRYWIKETKGKRIGFINYNFSIKGSAQNALADITQAKKEADLVIVCPHWGTEYKTGDPGQKVIILAHQFVDAGADLIIGNHPHVVQKSEVYEDKKIYYSLGNFIFDQYWSVPTQKGLAVKVIINPKEQKLEFEEIPLTLLKNGQTKVGK